MTRRYPHALVATLFFAGTAFAQITEFPVPMWPASGTIPDNLKDKYVFVDLPKNQYVLAYPENLASPTFEKDGPKALKVNRYDLLRNVEPAVRAEVTRVDATKVRYAYAVANSPSAKQSIDQFVLIVPEQAAAGTIKHPNGWLAIVQKGRTFKLKDPNLVRGGGAAVWSFAKPEEVIAAGAVKKGFELESDLRPGLTVGFFRKAPSVDPVVATSGNIPKPVKDQLDTLMSVEFDSKAIVVIGPKFDKSADERTIAQDFANAIGLLGSSDFLKALANDLKSTPVQWTAQAKTPEETDILNALKLSLGR